MRILFLAPQPFYQDRGSPIAVKMVIDQLSRHGDSVDLVTYHLGEPIDCDHISHIRIAPIPFIKTVRPGFSWQKLVCDFLMLILALRLVLTRRYDVVYAVEEAVFIALLFKLLFKIPYIYDMDSSLVEQMVDKYPWLKSMDYALRYFEGLALRHTRAAVVVCDALHAIARAHRVPHIVLLYDAPDIPAVTSYPAVDLRQKLGITGVLAMYAGNLEPYQGIDLLLDSFACLLAETDVADLVIIGGERADIDRYEARCQALEISCKVHFLGTVAYKDVLGYLTQADILCSPRIRGTNTPMKIYSYLLSGVAIVATDLWTHRQILDDTTAYLVKPDRQALTNALLTLASNPDERSRLGRSGKRLLESRYSYDMFTATFSEFILWLSSQPGIGIPTSEQLEIETVT